MAQFTGALNDIKRQWFQSQSAVGQSTNDIRKDFNNKKNSSSSFGFREGLDKYLAGLGYVGAPNDRYRNALIKALGGSANSAMSMSELETKFYSDSANVFVVGP